MPGYNDLAKMIERGDRSRPHFYYRQVQDVEKSEECGFPVFKDVPYVKIFSPGNALEIPDFRVKKEHQRRWPREWEAFLKGEEVPLNGFPLEEWPRMTRSMVETLKGLRIFTLEDFVAASDQNIRQIGPMFVNAKYQAKEFLETHGSEKARIERLEAEKAELEARISKLEAKISGDESDSETSDEPDEAGKQVEIPGAGRNSGSGRRTKVKAKK